MKMQNMGGSVMFNLSKQAINPGKDFGPYGIAKSSTLFLMKQYALELGKYNIRVNGVNADRIQSGILTNDLISKRAKARNTTKEKYLKNNFINFKSFNIQLIFKLCFFFYFFNLNLRNRHKPF